MNLEITQKAAHLWRDLKKVEDKIKFFKQFVPKDKTDRILLFPKKNAPKLEILTTLADNNTSYFQLDDELTEFLIHAYEAKREKLLKDIDAL